MHNAFQNHPTKQALQIAENERAVRYRARKRQGDLILRVEISTGDIVSMVRIGVLQDDQRQDRAAIVEALMQLAITGYRALKDGYRSRADLAARNTAGKGSSG